MASFINDNNPVPLWSVVVTLLAFIGGSIAMTLWAIFTENNWQRVFIIPIGLIILTGTISLIVWLSYASNAKELDYTEDVEVKTITFPDGSTAQML